MSDRPTTTATPGLEQVRQDASVAAREIQNRAGEAAQTVQAHASQIASEAAEQGREVLGVAQARAEGMIEEGKAAGAEQAQGLARAIQRAADDLDQTSPEIARHVRSAAGAVEGIAQSLRDRSAGELFDEVTNFARRQPAAFFGAAALVGFALARFAKASSPRGGMHGPSYGVTGRDMPHAHHSGLEHHDGMRSQHLPANATMGEGGARMVPGWTPDHEGRPSRPATMSGASLGGAAAHRQGQGQPGSMPTTNDTAAETAMTSSGGGGSMGTSGTGHHGGNAVSQAGPGTSGNTATGTAEERAGRMTNPAQGASL